MEQLIVWKELPEEVKRDRYEAYKNEVRYEWGDNAKYMTYEEFCRDMEELEKIDSMLI